VPPNVQDAFKDFTLNASLLALPLSLQETILHPLAAIQFKDADSSRQTNLRLLEDILSPTKSLYLLLRRGTSIFAITFAPYRAPQDERRAYLQYRNELVKLLGEDNFKMSMICKEAGEITDARSWAEREQHQGDNADPVQMDACDGSHEGTNVRIEDLGHKKNKCRLCDRRMKNKITDEAWAALRKLEDEGDLVQIVSVVRLPIWLFSLTTSVSGGGPQIGSRSPDYVRSG
jgi:twinfilin-like protein